MTRATVGIIRGSLLGSPFCVAWVCVNPRGILPRQVGGFLFGMSPGLC